MFYSLLHVIVDSVAAVFGGLMLLRFWLYALRARPPLQLWTLIHTLTNWLVAPLQKIIPATNKHDWASFVGTVLIAFVTAIAKSMMIVPIFMIKIVLILTLLSLINWIIYGIMGLMILEVIFSWINPNAPLAPFVQTLNRPFLDPIRKLIPPIAGIDLSVLIAFVLLNLASKFIPQLILRLG